MNIVVRSIAMCLLPLSKLGNTFFISFFLVSSFLLERPSQNVMCREYNDWIRKQAQMSGILSAVWVRMLLESYTIIFFIFATGQNHLVTLTHVDVVLVCNRQFWQLRGMKGGKPHIQGFIFPTAQNDISSNSRWI